LGYATAVWYILWSFAVCIFPILVSWTKENLATLDFQIVTVLNEIIGTNINAIKPQQRDQILFVVAAATMRVVSLANQAQPSVAANARSEKRFWTTTLNRSLLWLNFTCHHFEMLILRNAFE
jgi:hypothetical protein